MLDNFGDDFELIFRWILQVVYEYINGARAYARAVLLVYIYIYIHVYIYIDIYIIFYSFISDIAMVALGVVK